MKIGIRIPGALREMKVEALAGWLSASGFKALDLSVATAEAKRACEAADIAIGTVDARGGSPITKDAAEQRKAVEGLKEILSDIAAHGGRTLFTTLSPADRTMPRAESFAIWKEVYPEIVAHAEKSGVHIAVEPYPGGAPHYPNLGCSPETWRAMFSAIPSPHLGMCFDPSHMVRMGIDYMRVLREFPDRVRHVHAKDCEILSEGLYEFGNIGQSFGRRYRFGEGWWRYTIPGYGEVNWGRFLARLEETGYDGILSIELEDHRYSGTEALEKEGLLAAKRHLEQYVR
ncbi:MAG: sugar phosphate isomerase/epimerase [Candidatus Latescibacteria bacterium]|nr:sugar phosphate isomerase/epimerase [Candidatus Latescibacterota bacterium]